MAKPLSSEDILLFYCQSTEIKYKNRLEGKWDYLKLEHQNEQRGFHQK